MVSRRITGITDLAIDLSYSKEIPCLPLRLGENKMLLEAYDHSFSSSYSFLLPPSLQFNLLRLVGLNEKIASCTCSVRAGWMCQHNGPSVSARNWTPVEPFPSCP